MERHKDDATSVHAWVEEMKKKGDGNPVLLYKPQGETPPEQYANLQDGDFVLVLQTPLQAEMLLTLGPKRIVYVERTHGTNGYDFTLITTLVIDEFGEGFPVAWCLSNRTDRFLLTYYFQAVKNKVGAIVPEGLKSDDAQQFYTAWITVFRSGPQKLLCTWHVDRAW